MRKARALFFRQFFFNEEALPGSMLMWKCGEWQWYVDVGRQGFVERVYRAITPPVLVISGPNFQNAVWNDVPIFVIDALGRFVEVPGCVAIPPNAWVVKHAPRAGVP